MKKSDALVLGAKRHRFQPSGFFVIRTPLLPFEAFETWSEGLEAPGAAGASALEEAIGSDRRRLRARLGETLARPEVREAIFLASPNLEETIPIWERDPGSKRGPGIEHALVRYVSRASSRPTPFGLFAGCSTGALGPHTVLSIGASGETCRHTRLDSQLLSRVGDRLLQEEDVRRALVYVPNSSLYEAAGRVRFAAASVRGRARAYHLVVVEPTDYLRATIERARSGATIAELAGALTDEDVTIDDATVYVDELVSSQILVPELEPPVTGDDPTAAFADALPEVGAAARAREVLGEVRAEIAAMDAGGAGVDPARYRGAAERLRELDPDLEMAALFQVDMTRPARDAVLGSRVLLELSRGIEVLRRLEPAPGTDGLSRFRSAFRERYGDREMALVEVLDEEGGIGFEGSAAPATEAPLLEGIPLARDESPTFAWGALHTHLLNRMGACDPERSPELPLEMDQLEKLVPDARLPLPDAFQIKGTVCAASSEALRSGAFRVVLDSVAGPSGARLLGRFCHTSRTLTEHVRAHLRQEEAARPDAIFAEIVHLPEGRMGNILFRPVLREHEIPYLGRSGAPPDRRIPITDLTVSVRADRIVLRSRRLGREIVPRLSSAHNFSLRALGVYRFLCELQPQGSATRLMWDWGPLGAAPFLPRVVVGNVVLARATWTAPGRELREIGAASGTELFERVQLWRRRRKLPRLVYLADADNRLLIDLDNILSIESVVPLLKQRQRAVLVEMYPSPEELCVQGPDGRFVHEIVVPFVRHGATTDTLVPRDGAARSPATAVAPPRGFRRCFAPGSEWLYAKLYTGTSSADGLLLDAIAPLVREARAAGTTDLWFFIRYADPAWHLRVRFHGRPEALRESVLPSLGRHVEALLTDGRLQKLQLDTYEREVERYGGAFGVEVAERLFAIDSDAALAMLETVSGEGSADARWRIALLGSDRLLAELGLDEGERLALLGVMSRAYAQEFRAGTETKRQIGARFVREREALQALLEARSSESWAGAIEGILARRAAAATPVVETLRSLGESGRLTASIPDLAQSYVHMHVNRVLRSAHRAQELVLYSLLHRLHLASHKRRAGN